MIYLIGGPPRCGKTILAQKLAKSLRVSWVPVDTLEGMPKHYIPKSRHAELLPKDAIRKQTKNSNDLMYTTYSARQIVKAYQKQADTIWRAVEQFILYALGENRDFIIEGYQLPISKVARLVHQYPKQIKAVYLYKLNIENIEDQSVRFAGDNDWFTRKTRDPKTYIAIAKMLSLYGKQTQEEVERYKLKAFRADHDFTKQIKAALNYLTTK